MSYEARNLEELIMLLKITSGDDLSRKVLESYIKITGKSLEKEMITFVKEDARNFMNIFMVNGLDRARETGCFKRLRGIYQGRIMYSIEI